MTKLMDINLADRDGFVAVCGPLFEHSPWIAERAWAARPFGSLEQLHKTMCRIVADSTTDVQLALIRAHPDLVGRLAREGRLTPQSNTEQAAAGLTELTAEEAAEFERYNAAYCDRFGFPFVICARQNRKQAILAAFPVRLRNDRDTEIENALKEIYQIARLRMTDAISEDRTVHAKLASQCYGKTSVRVTKVRRLSDRHELVEMNVNISLAGSFERSYTHGDNSSVIATDSMKNTVYLLAKSHAMDSPEAFALHLAEHFVATYPQVSAATVNIDQALWRRIAVDGIEHPTAFESAGAELRQAKATVDRNEDHAAVSGQLSELLLLKTTDSAFAGFVRDRYTTLPEVTDRILASKVSAEWEYEGSDVDFNSAYSKIRTALLETFAKHKSDAVQQTLFDMGAAALAAEPSIESISLRMPNKHRIPFNFKPFGLEFTHDVYATTDEPSGEIVGHLTREKE
jgi:urate oxidase